MFSLKIVDTDAFTEMPNEAQLLYFRLCLAADDDGFVANPRRVMRSYGIAEDSMKILIAKKFTLVLKRDESAILLIKHWRMHNTLSKQRYHETTYIEEKHMLKLKPNMAYSLETGNPIDDSRLVEMFDGKAVETVVETERRTSGEQVENADLDLDLDKDLDIKEKEIYKEKEAAPKKKETAIDMLNAKKFSPRLRKAVEEWALYKKERRQSYQPTGFKSLLTQVENNVSKYGEEAVIEVIQMSMGQNWQGIAWGKLKDNHNASGKWNGYYGEKSGGGEYKWTERDLEESL